jgi:tetratricopeptide (TPR) repeat protein
MKKLLTIIFLMSIFIRGVSQSLKDEYNECAVEKYQQQDYAGAIEYFTRVIELSPNDSIAYFDRAMAKEYLGDYKGAIEDYTKQIAIDNEAVDSYFLRGMAEHHLKYFESAIADFTKTVELESTNGDAFYWSALSKTELGNYKEAIGDCDKAIKLKPQEAKYYFQRGKLYLVLKKSEDACNDYSIYKALGGEMKNIPVKLPCEN